jgi:hypothetical protein
MILRRAFLVLAPIALRVVLIALLIRIGKIDGRLTWHQWECVRMTFEPEEV